VKSIGKRRVTKRGVIQEKAPHEMENSEVLRWPVHQLPLNAINGLTAGTNYSIEVRAIGGSTGYSDWSDPVSHMSL